MARFVTIGLDEAIRNGWIEEAYDAEYRSGVFDTSKDPPLAIFCDGGEPEDQKLYRDLSVFPATLNELDAELSRLRGEVEGLTAHADKLAGEVERLSALADTQCHELYSLRKRVSESAECLGGSVLTTGPELVRLAFDAGNRIKELEAKLASLEAPPVVPSPWLILKRKGKWTLFTDLDGAKEAVAIVGEGGWLVTLDGCPNVAPVEAVKALFYAVKHNNKPPHEHAADAHAGEETNNGK